MDPAKAGYFSTCFSHTKARPLEHGLVSCKVILVQDEMKKVVIAELKQVDFVQLNAYKHLTYVY